MLGDEISFTHRGERHFRAPRGTQAGSDGACAYAAIQRATGLVDVIPSKISTLLRRGDRVIVLTAGGGGNGGSPARLAASAAEDIADGKTLASSDAALKAEALV
jgi:N-methylhydantoinase B/oxoprolinase/acetone carboxylase alpha subunit